MKLPDKLVEYALIGSLFWLAQTVFLFLSGATDIDDLAAWLKRLDALYLATPAVLKPLAVSLITASSIVFVFFTGFLLHITGNLFVLLEVYSFTLHLKRNSTWLTSLVEDNAAYLQNSYETLTQYDWESGSTLIEAAWSFSLSGVMRDYRTFFERYRLLDPFDRLQSFLLSFAYTFSEAEKNEPFADVVREWKTARVLSVILGMLILEVFLLAVFSAVRSSNTWAFTASVAALILAAVPLSVAPRAYNRFCSMLFSLVYMGRARLDIKSDSSNPAAQADGSATLSSKDAMRGEAG